MSFTRKIVALLFTLVPVIALGQVHLESSYNETNSTIRVTMTNEVAVAEIQFDLVDTPEAFTVTGVSSSTSLETFSSSANGTILGFSFSGNVIDAGTHTLCEIEIDLTGSYTVVTIDNTTFADSETNNLTVTTGDSIVIGDWVPTNDVYLSFGEIDGDVLPLMINSNVDIYGFQFKISDMPEALDIVGTSGGAAADAGWTVQASPEGVVLGFTFSLTPIVAGDHTLINLELGNFSGAYTEIYVDDIADFEFSDINAGTIQDVAHGDGILWGDLPDAPVAPTNLSGETLGNSINLSWEGSDLAEVYNVYRDGFNIAQTGVTFFTDSGLNFGTDYTYHVTAENISGESDASSAITVATEDTPPPPEPMGLSAVGNDGSVDLAWVRPAVPVDGYEQCFESCDEFPWELGIDHYIDGGNGGWFRGEDGTYSGCGTGLNTCGSDADGNAAIAIWTASGVHTESRMVTPPVDLTGNSSASLSYWGAYIYTSYATMDNLVEVSTDGGATWTTVFTDSPFSMGDVIYEQNIDLSAFAGEIVTVAFNFRDNSWGEAWFIDDIAVLGDAAIVSNPNVYPLNIPTSDRRGFDLEMYGAHVTDIIENIDRDRSLVGYNVYRSESMGAGYELVEAIDDSEEMYTDNTVTNGTTYYYVVTAQYDIEGESLYSNEAMATPMATTAFIVWDAEVVGGDEVSVTVEVHNPNPASSINFTLTGDANVLDYTSYTTTGYPDDWNITVTGQGNGNVVFNAFGSEDVGGGSSVTFTYSSSAGMPVTVEMCTVMEDVNDTNGNDFFIQSDCGNVDVTLDYSVTLDVNVITEMANLGEEVAYELSMNNTVDVFGVEFIVADNPNNITNMMFESTARIPGDWTVSAEENANGQIVVMASGSSPLTAGDGVLFNGYSLVDETALASNTTIYYAMAGVVDSEMNYLYIAELGDDAFEVYPGFLPPALNLVAESGFDSEVPLNWDSPQGGGGGGGPDPDGVGEPCEGCGAASCITDCELQCVDEATANSWIGDGYCDDGTWGMYLDCEFFSFDGGDCGEVNPSDCESLDEFSAVGIADLDGDGSDDPCYDPGDGILSAYFIFYWNAGCTATGLFYNGTYMDLTPYNFTDGSSGVILYGVDANATYELQLESGATLSPTVTITTGDCQGAIASTQPEIHILDSQNEKNYYEVQDVEFVMPESRNANREANYRKAPISNRRDVIEISYHDGNPTNGYYQTSVGYGVVFDLSEYGGASIEMLDFSHYGWGVADGGEYNLFVVNMDNGEIIYETSGEATGAMSANVWVEGIGLGSVIAPSNQIGVFLQPLADHSAGGTDDWYPCLDSDGATGASNSGIYDFDSGTFTVNTSVGNFLMDLWIDATPTNIDLDISGYNVYRSDDNGASWSDAGTTEETEFLDGDVMNGQEYQYYVTTEYEGMYESGASNIASAVPSTWVTLTMTDANILAGTTGTIELSLSNQEEVSGFEVNLTDTPNNLVLTGVTATERVPTDWSQALSFNEGPDGNATLLAFSFAGTTIAPGDGPVFLLEFTSNATEPTEVSLCTANEVITDTALPFANEFPVNSACSTVIADVEGIEITLIGDGGVVDQGGTFDLDFSVNNPYPIYGFEIHLSDTPEGVTSIASIEGDRLPAGGMFSVQENDDEVVVIWFSLTLTPIDAGDGSLFTITYQVNDDAVDGEYVWIDVTDETVFSDNLGSAMYYRDPETYGFSAGAYDATLRLEQFGEGSFKVWMNNTDEVSGFQVKVVDNPDQIEFSSVSNGTECSGNCIPGDWSVSGNESAAGGMNILGFSFTGTTIGVGSGVLLEIDYDWVGTEDSTEICFGQDFSEMTSPSNETYYLDMTECATLYRNPLGISEIEMPTVFELDQNHPNPFNPVTTINFSIPEQTFITLKVFDLSGRLVKTLWDSQMNVGHHSINWNGVDTYGSEVAAGIYIYTLEGKDLFMSRKMILMK